MRRKKIFLLLGCYLIISPLIQAVTPVEELFTEYRQQGAHDFSAEAGRKLWNQAFHPDPAGSERQCASCHTTDPRHSGRHVTTNKEIKPLAPSVTGKRLTNTAKIRKWLDRNCKWTLGRECTAQEKGDVLMYLKDL